MFKQLIKNTYEFYKNLTGDFFSITNIKDLLVEQTILEIKKNRRYKNSKSLINYEFQVYSQNGEDGIIEEIFERIGLTNKFFIEIGAGNGLENNTAYLLFKNWKGIWFEASSDSVKKIKENTQNLDKSGKLKVVQSFVTVDNINKTLRENKCPKQFDLLSIDIDGNDYWIWQEIIRKYNPRCVVIEYNGTFGSTSSWIMKYNARHIWHTTSYYGASLKALELLGNKLGYALVGCNLTGINAFFVRKELVKDLFLKPFTSENHYEPPRYFLMRNSGLYRNTGHKRVYDNFNDIS